MLICLAIGLGLAVLSAVGLVAALVSGVASAILWRNGRFWQVIPVVGAIAFGVVARDAGGAGILLDEHVVHLTEFLNRLVESLTGQVPTEPIAWTRWARTLAPVQIPAGVVAGPFVAFFLRHRVTPANIDRERYQQNAVARRSKRSAGRRWKRNLSLIHI